MAAQNILEKFVGKQVRVIHTDTTGQRNVIFSSYNSVGFVAQVGTNEVSFIPFTSVRDIILTEQPEQDE